MRRTHRKSRFGCRVCKQRHIKCDESKPSCLNCVSVGRRCSYLDDASTLPSPTASARESPRPSSTPAHSHQGTAPQRGVLGEDYTLSHIELFYHFEHHVAKDLGDPGCGTDDLFTKRFIQESFNAPYLMDEILAFSAAHKSTLNPGRKDVLLTEATRLQTRGLSRFNAAQTELSDDNCIPIFMYSAILGQHVLFDTFSLQCDFPAVVSKFVQCFSIHRGIRTIAASSWKKIHKELLGGDTAMLLPVESVKSDDECAPLLILIDESELGEEAKGDCRETAKTLQLMFSRHRHGTLRSALAVQEWAVRVPTGYITLLDQRRPEALIILAYYAALLHHGRAYWAIGATGVYLVRSISDHLGEYWARWLGWPNAVVAGESAPGLATGCGTVP